MFKLLVAIAIIFLPGHSAFARELTVATWNLSNFSGRDRTGCNPRTQHDYDQIRNIINAVAADVWLFQEVDSAGSLARIMDTSSWILRAETRSEPANPIPCSSVQGQATMQRTVIAVNKDVKLTGHRELSFLDTTGVGALRHGMVVTIIAGGQRVHVANVHLKSGCFSGTSDESCGSLFEQIPYLASFAAEIDGFEDPLLIGGDFNRRLAEPDDGVMHTLSYNHTVGLEITSPTGVSKCSLRNKRPIDYQLASKRLLDRVNVTEAFEHSFNGPFENWPSDHCPVVVRYEFNP